MSKKSSNKGIAAILILVIFVVLIAILGFFWLSNENKAPLPTLFIKPSPSTTEKVSGGILFAMSQPPLEKTCDYPAVILTAGDAEGFEKARSCGTKILALLFNKTSQILGENGAGLSLSKYEEVVKAHKGEIDEYVDDGTVFVIGVVDEPHDCKDWGGECPNPEEVDEAAKIVKKYWPNAKTFINTLPNFSPSYEWQNVDIVNFQYSFHKIDLETFISQGLALKEKGLVKDVGWALQAKAGGCERFKECSMTPEQVLEVGRAMCDTKVGTHLAFIRYDESLLTPEMLESIQELTSYCN